MDQWTKNMANGNGSTTKWLLGALFAIMMSTGGWVWTTTTDRISNLEDQISNKNERIAILETKVEQVKEQLNRIENKIDLYRSEQIKPVGNINGRR